jgi:HSP20 family protein
MTLPTYSFDVDQFLNEALRAVNGEASWAPACNTFEDQQTFWVQAALPGMDRNDIEIVMEDGVLTLKGERKEEVPQGRTYFTHEINSGKFTRSFRLPDTADPNRIVATYKDGVLSVELPKREETKPRKITIG